MSTQIIHKGTIKKIGKGTVTVMLETSGGDCAGCAVASLCSKGEEMSVDVPDTSPFRVGQKVKVRITGGMQRYATLLYLLVPVLLLILSLAAIVALGGSDTLAFCLSLAVLALWYGVVYLFRGRFSGGVTVENS